MHDGSGKRRHASCAALELRGTQTAHDGAAEEEDFMTQRYSRRTQAFQERRFASPDRRSEGQQDSALFERVSNAELREIVHQQRLHFLLLERAMQDLSSDVPDADAASSTAGSAQALAAPAARPALQLDLEAILLAELCDESELDSSMEIASPESTRGASDAAS
jgi:hypothetical protein